MRLVLLAALLALVGCGDDTSTPQEARWQLVASEQTSSLLGVWAPSTDNVWIVGGREGSGGQPPIWRYDGSAWQRLATGAVDVTNTDLWQVFGFADGTVFLGGSNGTILRYRDGTFEKIPTPPSADIVFGFWGASSDDVWAVGGGLNARGFVWRYQGTAFEAVAGVPAELATGTVWKVTGRSASDVWMSCSHGLVLHHDGGGLTQERIGMTGESLFSIGCNDSRCTTAGTNGSVGVLYEDDGAGWASRAPTAGGPVWRGVTPTGDQQYVVGMVGAVIRRDEAGWVEEPHGLTTKPLHAAWASEDGSLFTVGGAFDRAITVEGVVLYKGTDEIPNFPL